MTQMHPFPAPVGLWVRKGNPSLLYSQTQPTRLDVQFHIHRSCSAEMQTGECWVAVLYSQHRGLRRQKDLQEGIWQLSSVNPAASNRHSHRGLSPGQLSICQVNLTSSSAWRIAGQGAGLAATEDMMERVEGRSGVSTTCPRRCSCDPAQSVQCYRATEIPREIPFTTRRLYISHSKIKQLQIADFRRMSALEELVLSCSGTESIENNTFKALSTLKSLELYKNQLQQIPTFLPSGLEILKLADNSINTLHASDFEGLMKLRVLDIRNNLIATLPPSAFSSLCNLQSLILDGNHMESVSAPLQLPRLKYLSMADNKLNSFPTNFFASFKNLQFLSLSGNFLTKVPLDLPKSLLSLKLEKNQLKTVRLRDMKHLENLSEFFLSENQLTSVDGAQLLPNLTTLELSKNQLHTMPLRLPGRLQKLDCSDNLIQRVTAQDFQGLQDLKHLFLDNNAVSTFEAGALQQCVQLSNLALEQNLLISIPLRLPDTLARLDLKGNDIQDVGEQELKDLKQLQVLNLRNNKISALDRKVLEYLPRLRHLYLDGNPWNCTCDLLRTRRALVAKGTDVRGGQCAAPAESRGESWMSSKKILQQCEENLSSMERGKEDRKKMKPNEAFSVGVNADDDYYDYELD
ncbi:PREDICTED: carboxypeptidase N subunit 2-like [Leptosomus discolor]|uniref:carboxypeptidase N subunit 2-like n=1 Tax=Leptosomus discolor TaxID=188344 RepID=UPI00052281A1|nr:PREDICTED: carboxypeptidase N subunit 2-like [Leptosomus discolor]